MASMPQCNINVSSIMANASEAARNLRPSQQNSSSVLRWPFWVRLNDRRSILRVIGDENQTESFTPLSRVFTIPTCIIRAHQCTAFHQKSVCGCQESSSWSTKYHSLIMTSSIDDEHEVSPSRYLVKRPKALQWFHNGQLQKESEEERQAGRFELFLDLLCKINEQRFYEKSD